MGALPCLSFHTVERTILLDRMYVEFRKGGNFYIISRGVNAILARTSCAAPEGAIAGGGREEVVSWLSGGCFFVCLANILPATAQGGGANDRASKIAR